MTKAVIFDLGWTLMDLVGSLEFDKELAVELGPERWAIVQSAFIEAHRRVIGEGEWVRTVAAKISATAGETEQLQKKLHWPHYKIYPDTLPALQALKARGLKLAIVSNANAWVRGAIEEIGIAEYLDSTIISCEVGVMKPDRKIFELALKELGCEPADALMVGDSIPIDIVGAQAAGIPALLLDRMDGTDPNNMSNMSDAPDSAYSKRITSLLEVPKFL